MFVSDEFDGMVREGLPEGRKMNKWMEADGFSSVEGDLSVLDLVFELSCLSAYFWTDSSGKDLDSVAAFPATGSTTTSVGLCQGFLQDGDSYQSSSGCSPKNWLKIHII